MVKKQILIMSAIIFGLIRLNAQDSGFFEVGANCGLSLSTVYTANDKGNINYRVTFNIGLSSEYYFSDRWGIKFKLISDNKGWTGGSIIDENNNRFTTDIELHYITIPVMANWHFSTNRKWYLNLGPYMGVLTTANESKFGTDIKEQLNGLDYGLSYGIGYKFKLKDNLKLYFEYDGQLGFTDIFKENSTYSVNHNRGSYNVGVLINL